MQPGGAGCEPAPNVQKTLTKMHSPISKQSALNNPTAKQVNIFHLHLGSKPAFAHSVPIGPFNRAHRTVTQNAS